ncbi:hypothetical protein SAMN05216371_1673 [Streptomyces sp. TLI_053]|uniref:hypothetical protein n=1 Tax=Streptomyces sp. TLI_053 TaxID=1855352 RepID=UPI00087C62B3|nr:hypothetical protein [Streptomyces sp. TLI_053]SDT25492.1 hypothetical protein SAMN05216371_1673 [Streptomyces sp. TLI_053]
MAEETRRPGRPWNTPAQGSSVESTELAQFLRQLVNERGISIRQLQGELDHQGISHSVSTIARRLGGDNLEHDWDFILAVVEATTEDPSLRGARRRKAHGLMRAALDSPTPMPQDAETAKDLERLRTDHDVVANGTVNVIAGGVIHGAVNITLHQYATPDDAAAARLQQQLLTAREEIADLRGLLTEARRRSQELAEELHRQRSALDAAVRQLDGAPEHVRTIVRQILPPESQP